MAYDKDLYGSNTGALKASIIYDETEEKMQSTINAEQRAIIATREASTTASQAYDAGDYLILNGILYEVTDAIASGGTITVSGAGANVTATSVGAKLSDLFSKVGPFIFDINEDGELIMYYDDGYDPDAWSINADGELIYTFTTND